MGRPQAQHIVAIAREVIEIGFPEFKVPDRFNIVLRRIARVRRRMGVRASRGILNLIPRFFTKGGAVLILNGKAEAQEGRLLRDRRTSRRFASVPIICIWFGATDRI